jgi:hypothetical protein
MKVFQSTRMMSQCIHIMTMTCDREPMNSNTNTDTDSHDIQKGSFRPPNLSWWNRLEERLAKAKKENPFEIWIQEYKELLAFKKIEQPVYDDTYIV